MPESQVWAGYQRGVACSVSDIEETPGEPLFYWTLSYVLTLGGDMVSNNGARMSGVWPWQSWVPLQWWDIRPIWCYTSRSSPKTLHFNLCPCVHHTKPMGPGPLSDPMERNLYPGSGWRPCDM